MPPFLLRYAISLAAMLAAYGLYALAAVPFIEPEAKYKELVENEEEAANMAGDAMHRQQEQLSPLFPDKTSWELNSPKVLATQQGKLLFQEYQPLPDGRMELKPCTLVFFAGGAVGEDGRPSGRPIVMRAPAGAVLQFDRALNLGQADIGRLLGGRMLGEISITSRETRPGADDELEILTRNVQLDEEHIWTPHEVKFRYGPSYGGGRDLTISLVPKGKAEPGKPKTGGLENSGVRSLELVHVEKLHLVTSGGGLLPGGDSAASKPASAPALPVEIACRGPFRFDFQKLVASFEDQVDVRRLHPGGAFDALNCQLLEIYFGKADATKFPASANVANTKSASMSGVEVQRLVAVGHPVVLKGGVQGASASGQRFEYDLRTRRILLEDSQSATLKHDRHTIEARGVAYEMADEGRLGRLWAAGPGKFQSTMGADGKQRFEATWAKELRLRPHQGNHVISLTRDASLSFSSQGGMRADDIHVWLHETPPEGGGPSAKRHSISPDKLLAVGNVQIDSPQLSGNAPRLEAWFKTDTNEVGSLEAVGPAAHPFDDRRVNERGEVLPGQTPIDDDRPKRPSQKFHISGNIIQIQMLRRGSQTSAENVTVDGGVRLVEIPATGLKESPLDMRGDTLQLFQASSPQARARVTGQPALVAARGMKMSGTNIQLHRGENRVWIDGSGEMTLPAQRNPLDAVQRGGVDARREEQLKTPIAAGQTITVTWQQRMNFDGQTVRFEKQVEARGQTQFARGDVLEVTLNRRFDFSQPKPSDGVDVERVAFDGNVFLESRAIEDRQIVAIEQMQAKKLSLDNLNGRLNAVGPGWVKSVRLGGTSPVGMSGVSSNSRTAGKPASDGLNYLHIDFQTAIAGNLLKREIQFIDRVTAVYGPVVAWEQELSTDRLEDLPERGVLMNCDRLTVTEMGQTGVGQKLYEMEAAGNTRVEGKTFTATADRMTYAQAKDLIVLEGDGRADAELWRQSRVGGPTEHAAARKILYWQRDNRAQVDDARFLDLSQFGAPPPREAPRK